MRIDVHAHYWAASYIDLLVELGRSDLAHAGRQRDDLAERIATMDANGVEIQINSAIGLVTETPESAGAAGAVKAAQHINDVYAEAEQRFHGRFRSFGTVPLPYVDEAIEEVRRCLDDLHFVGIALPCSFAGKPIDHPDFAAFWDEIGRREAVVYVHPAGTNSMPHPGLKDYGLHTAFGSPLQIGVAAERMVFSGITRKYPGIKMIFAMCGGMLPFLWQRQERVLLKGLQVSATAAVGNHFFDWMKPLDLDPADPMGGLRKFWYDVSTQDMPLALLAAKNAYGADRLLLGSDEIFASLTEAVTYVQDSPYLSDDEKTAILDHNAQELLQLTPWPAG